jgi:predicted  nucleic acid-binding Zn-ribbon protein
MGYLKAKQLLVTLAKVQEKEKKNFNRLEIVKKMNEIKYLSTQKKVPRLTLRKEVIHLENKIEGILELEEELMKKKKHESKRIVSLKKQITNLKKKLTACQDIGGFLS